jgi:hypothetical protein
MLVKVKQTVSKKNTKNIVFGIVHINATFNNTIITIKLVIVICKEILFHGHGHGHLPVV